MKRKVVVALLAAMTLTLGTVGITFASPENPAAGVESTKDTEERPGYIWVVDQEEQGHWEDVMVPEEGHYEEVVIEPEEGHYEQVMVSPEEGHWEDVEVSPEKGHWETIHHEAVYETVHHDAEGYYETQQVQVGTEPVYENHRIATCNICGDTIWDTTTQSGPAGSDYESNIDYHWFIIHPDLASIAWTFHNADVQVGEKPIYEDQEVWIETKPAWDEEVLVSEAYDEPIWVVDEEAVYDKQWVVDKEAVYEDQWVVDKEAVTESQWVVDKPATVEKQWVVDVPEKGHWEPVNAENPDPETPETEKPTMPVEPETPDTEEPTPTAEPETPASDDTETPDSNNAGANQEAVPTPEQTATDNSQATDENKSQATDTASSDDKKTDSETTVPKTGDPTNLGYLISLAGSALAGGSALVWKFRKK